MSKVLVVLSRKNRIKYIYSVSPGREVSFFIDFFKGMLERIAVCEISKIDYRICIHFHTEALLIVNEPRTPIKQAI